MTCSDVEKVLPELLDSAPESFDTDFEIHLKSCPACSDLVSDLRLIASEAYQLAATDEPAPRVWVGIAAQLRAEGLIRESGPARRPSLPRRWTSTAWWLAPVAAALLAAGAYFISHQPAPQVAQSPSTTPINSDSARSVPASTPPKTPETQAETPAKIAAKAPVASPARPAPTGTAAQNLSEPAEMASSTPAPETEIAESGAKSSAEDQQFLSAVSTRAPAMRATYENQLQAVNNNIRQVQEYLRRNPADMDARQQLMDAYQQKALLYQIALDRIQ